MVQKSKSNEILCATVLQSNGSDNEQVQHCTLIRQKRLPNTVWLGCIYDASLGYLFIIKGESRKSEQIIYAGAVCKLTKDAILLSYGGVNCKKGDLIYLFRFYSSL